ncbi:MAG: sensor histidine kinase [Salinivirgaceae bacterium]
MKLLSKTSLLFITISILIFMFGNIFIFTLSKKMISNHVDTELVYQMHRVIKVINEQQVQNRPVWFTDEVEIKTVSKAVNHTPVFIDTVLYNTIQKKYVPHRSLRFIYPLPAQNLSVSIYKSLMSSDKLIERITISTIIMVVIFISMIFIMNRFVFERVWSDFFRNLKKLEHYDVKSHEKLELDPSEIEEFNTLNKVHMRMVERIQDDFVSLKELTANTSHEIQTPLAIIKSKAELLLQTQNLDENQLQSIGVILNTTERLSKLSQSLLLISKIENNQFGASQAINIKDVLEKFINNYQILFEGGEFQLKVELADLTVEMNPVLLDILVSNLLKNAVTHGSEAGQIHIQIKERELLVGNSGEPLKIEPDDLFKRFVKGSSNKNSSGLGLEIIRKIVDFYGFNVRYSYQNNLHWFIVNFSNISLNI